jgi:methylmalonyl-CoA mutase N-terminal domain/subunit
MIQREVQDSAYRAQTAIDAGDSVIVGLNRFTDEGDAAPIETLRIESEVETRQVERVRALRARRSADAVRSALDAVLDAARTSTNLVPQIIAAVEANATIGEICDAMRDVFGEYQETATI